MNIGVIGAGFIGRAVAQLALAAGHEVMLSNSRGPQTMSSVLSGIPGVQVGRAEDAAKFGELVLIAIPLEHYRAVLPQWLESKTVMDANNYYPQRDGHIPVLDRFETTTSRLLADHLPHAHVVKVFNAIFAPELTQDARPHGATDRRALPVAADDAAAKAQVIRLLDELGFDAVDAGGLDESWRFERAKPAYCVRLDQHALKAALAAAERTVELPAVERVRTHG
ncbi:MULTISPECIES: NADPH-dependent F420 reductase [unclassified Pseudomonas]|jgi:predicted dinucleotide-binding enzyme|uniref:NADPH-dependent F420 reductase n=1 Tax=unclassified Pseudomonas TaxID=196821 RepID=UPI001CFACD22|nr:MULTISPECIES: NAD(P)-binding domain-containing protein [unclassified Pseudomonas]WLH80862.1 NAD(P)-binding domain-containing protein [Pseudomonas sp. FP2335]